MDLSNIAFVDIETTGGKFNKDRIIEIGIIRVEDNKLSTTFQSFVNPQRNLSPYISYITGITQKDLEDAPSFEKISDEINDLLKDCVFIAHNVRFDYGFIRSEFERVGIAFTSKTLCTVKLSRHFYPNYTHHNLDSLIERFGFSCQNRHRAYDDAHVLWQFFNHLKTSFPKDSLDSAFKKVTKSVLVPLNLERASIERLPEKAGVYIFLDDKGTSLYVGESKNIKERVLSHFSQSLSSNKELTLFRQVKDIDYIPTTGEFGALLTESRLIKKLNPVYNRKLRKYSELFVITKLTDEDGYYVPNISTILDIEDTDDILATFKSKLKAKSFLKSISKEFNLCEKLLGTEKTSRACFGYGIKICKGACLKEESPLEYNARFINAFGNKKITPWPFVGPVLIEESDNNVKENFLFNEWVYYASVKSNGDDISVIPNAEAAFDIDVYEILKKYMGKLKVKIISLNEMNNILNNFLEI